MSAPVHVNINPVDNGLEGLRRRMIREVECFLEGGMSRPGWRRAIPTDPRVRPSPPAIAARPSWYDNRRASLPSGERGPC